MVKRKRILEIVTGLQVWEAALATWMVRIYFSLVTVCTLTNNTAIDASVTQSALEEALASRMQEGGTISSLRGTIGNVFRSRYQGKLGNAP